MIRLFRLFKSSTQQYPNEQEIHDEQFLDKDGKVHMNASLSLYDRDISTRGGMNESSIADNFIDLFYSTPISYDEWPWEKTYVLERYNGGLRTFNVKPNIKRIGVRAFSYNINLNEVTLPIGLEVIDKEAFSSCSSLLSITIPSTVRYIGKDAFDRKIEKLVLLCEIPPRISVLGISNECEIIVPINTYSIYKDAPCWKKYAKQIHEIYH